MSHRIVWFDIPVTDLDRATDFYRQVLDINIDRYGDDVPVAVMAHGAGDVAGCLALNEGFSPSEEGPLLYFTVDGRLDAALGLVEGLGGRVLEPPRTRSNRTATGPSCWIRKVTGSACIQKILERSRVTENSPANCRAPSSLAVHAVVA